MGSEIAENERRVLLRKLTSNPVEFSENF